MKKKWKHIFIVCVMLITMLAVAVPASAATAANLSIGGKTKAIADIGEYKYFFLHPNYTEYQWNNYPPFDDY